MGTFVLIGALNAFHFLGALLAIWAVSVTAIVVRRADFPRTSRMAWLVGATSVVLTVGAIGSAIVVGALEEDEKSEEAAAGERSPAPSGGELRLAADPSGELRFDKSELEAKASTVAIAMTNDSSVGHDISITGGTVNEGGDIVKDGRTSTVRADLKPGTYTFFCSVAGHQDAGMEGKLTVR